MNEIIYKKGKQNVVADALWRKDEDIEGLFSAISIPQYNWVEEARIEWKKDQKACKNIRKLQEDPNAVFKFMWKIYLLWYQYHPCLCNSSQLKHKILMELHTLAIVGHLVFLKTYHSIKKDFS